MRDGGVVAARDRCLVFISSSDPLPPDRLLGTLARVDSRLPYTSLIRVQRRHVLAAAASPQVEGIAEPHGGRANARLRERHDRFARSEVVAVRSQQLPSL